MQFLTGCDSVPPLGYGVITPTITFNDCDGFQLPTVSTCGLTLTFLIDFPTEPKKWILVYSVHKGFLAKLRSVDSCSLITYHHSFINTDNYTTIPKTVKMCHFYIALRCVNGAAIEAMHAHDYIADNIRAKGQILIAHRWLQRLGGLAPLTTSSGNHDTSAKLRDTKTLMQ